MVGAWRHRAGDGAERGSAVVDFALVSALALLVGLAVSQLALYLYQRNVLMGSLSEGARVAAAEGHTVAEGRQRAATLVRTATGARVAGGLTITAATDGTRVVLRATGGLRSFVPVVPSLPIDLTASMHKEEDLVPTQGRGSP